MPGQQRFRFILQLLALGATLCLSGTAQADPFFGYVQFSSDGTNNFFEVDNLTNDNFFGGIPPYDIATPVTFLNSILTLNEDGGGTIVLHPSNDGTPGEIDPIDFAGAPCMSAFPGVATCVPNADHFTSASFSATLSTGTTPLLLSDGTFFTPSSSSVTAIVLPSIGTDLTANVDFGNISVAAVPEPSSLVLLIIVLPVVSKLQKIIRQGG